MDPLLSFEWKALNWCAATLKTMKRYLRFSKEYLPRKSQKKTMKRYLRFSIEYLPHPASRRKSQKKRKDNFNRYFNRYLDFSLSASGSFLPFYFRYFLVIVCLL